MSARLSKKTAIVEAPNGVVRLAVVADTHSNPHPRTAELLAAAKPDRILHAGDIGRLSVLDELAAIAPMLAVRGNIDELAVDVPDALTVELREDGEELLRILIVHQGVYGPKLRADAARLAVAEHASIVVCGHSHVPFIGKDRGLTVFNPGSIGPRRFHLPIVFGIIELRDRRIQMHHVDCETGARWTPGPPPMAS